MVNYNYIHVSPTSPTCVLFTTLHSLHCVHVSPTSPTYVPITVQRNYLPYKWQPGNAQFSCSLVVPYFSQSLGAWASLPNTSTTLSHHSPQGIGVGVQRVPLGGFCFKQSCIQNKLHSMYYITCTVKSPTPPTGVSFKLSNLLRVYVLCV